MSITPPPLIDVKPGDPITSERWNYVLTALRMAYDALNKSLGSLSMIVKNQADGMPIPGAVVTIIPTGDTGRPVRTAAFAAGDDSIYPGLVNRYLAHELQPGVYDVVFQAPGYAGQTRQISMDQLGGSQSFTIEMVPSLALFAMPSLFGMPLNTARDTVVAAGFQLARIIDSHGKEIPASAVPDDVVTNPVLGQLPEPGTLIPKNTPVQLHISAKAEFAERVKVPDLRGLTLEEAKAMLEAAHLVLGETSNVGAKRKIIAL